MKTPIKFISLSLRNFQSYGNNKTTISLDFSDPTLIIGRNLDAMVNGQIDSNGSGKTTLINALSWVLYDKPISKISQDRLINNINKKNLEVTLIFEKDEKYYKIIRYRKNKTLGDNGAKVYQSDTLDFSDNDIARDSIANINTQIEEIVGIPYDIFTRIVIYSARNEPFFSLPVTSTSGKSNQSDIMEELCGITEISAKGELLNKTLKEDKKELESLLRIEEQITQQKEQYKDKLKLLESRVKSWDENQLENIKIASNKIDEYKNIDFDFQRECINHFNKLNKSLEKIQNTISIKTHEASTLKSKLSSAQTWQENHDKAIEKLIESITTYEGISFDKELEYLNQYDVINDDIKTYRQSVEEKTKKIADNSKKMSKNTTEIEHLQDNRCPYCLQKFVNVQEKLDSLEKESGDLYTQNVNLEKETNKIIRLIEDLKDEKSKLIDMMKYSSITELKNVENQFNALTKELEVYQNQSNPYEDVDTNQIISEITKYDDELNRLQTSKTSTIEKINIVKAEMKYTSETSLANDYNAMSNLFEKIEKLKIEVNPHLETLNDINQIKFDSENSKKIDSLEDIILHKTFLYKLLTKKDSFIRKSLLNRSLPYLNKQLKKYLSELGMPHKVEFTEDLTASISQFGNVLDFDNLSSGQQARVNLALSFSFRDVLQLRYGKIGFCILDECLDVGLGSVGVQMAAKMIKKIATSEKLSMFIISHRDEITNLFPNIMEIELDKGFSRILDSKLSSSAVELI